MTPSAYLIHGHVMHERLRPVLHRFVYPVFYLRLNLARLDQVGNFWFGVNRHRLMSLRTRDYGPRDGSDLDARLHTGGHALIQTITITEQYFERYRTSSDFIRQYIFPGGMLPSPEGFCARARSVGLLTLDQYRFGFDYAATLRRWYARFEKSREVIMAQGFDQRFMRLWQLYYAYCEAGFDEERTDVIQFTLCKN